MKVFMLAATAFLLIGCESCVASMIPGEYSYDSQQRREQKDGRRDDHGCLKSKCYWRTNHCSCKGDEDYDLL